MINDCINKNTNFYKSLVIQEFTPNEIAQITDKISQPSFLKWYGNGEFDTFEQPRLIKDLYLVNDKSERITLNDLLNDKFYEKRQNYSKDLTSLDKINSFLEDAKIGITKRISAYRGSGYAEKLTHLLEELDKLNTNDYLKALDKHSEYILTTVEDFEMKFYNYDKVNVAKLSKEEKQKRDKVHKNFLIHANDFLQTFSKIKNLDLPVNDKTGGEIVEKLIQVENQVTQLQNRVNSEIEAAIRDTLQDLISNPDVRNGVIDFLAAQTDESKVQLLMDALGDSHITFIAAIDKFYKKAMFSKDEEVKVRIKEWDKLIARHSNFDAFLNKILEKDKEGKRTGKFISKYSYEYYETRNKFVDELKSIANTESPEYKKALSTYIKWKKKNTKKFADGTREPTDKWISEEYKKLSEQEQKDLREIQSTLLYLTSHTKDDIIKKGYLPAIPKDTRSGMEILKGKKIDRGEDFVDKAITESDEIVKFIPFKYVQKLNQTATIKPIPDGATKEETEQIEKENKEAREANRKRHAESLDYDLSKTMKTFIRTALTNKYKTDIELDIKLFKEQLKRQKIKRISSRGNQIYDKIKSSVKGSKVDYETSAIGSNAEKHFNEWLDGVFYEDFELDEGILSDWTAKIQNFTSLRALGFNVLSGVNNKLIGNVQARIESVGGVYFNYKDYRRARKDYFNNITHIVANHKTNKSDNKIDSFIKYFDVLVSQDELSNRPDGLVRTALHKLTSLKNTAYFMQHIGEHQVQNATLLSMSYSHRIVDNKIINFNEFLEDRQIKIDFDKKMSKKEIKEALENIEKNEELRKTLEEEFNKFPSVFDSFETKDGELQAKEKVNLGENEIFNFKQRVIGINQRLHGIYNIEDAGTMQRYALGRLAIQFRKWMRPGWNRRFGSKFGKKIYNERIRDYEEGMYVSAFKFIADPFIQNFRDYKKAEQKTAYLAFNMIVSSFKSLILDAKVRWHSLSEIERANVKKTSAEFLFLMSVTAIGFLAKSLKGDDDDDELKEKSIVFVLYQADRLFGELTTFTPIGVVREGNRLFSSPSPVFNTFEDIGKLGTAMFLYPFRDEEERTFKSGIYHGKDKVGVYAGDMIPVYNQYLRILNMSENNQRYGMFK